MQAFWDTEADTLENLNDKLRAMIPELLILKGMVKEDY
ncbi:MAG: DUF1902 domain-containing protein [Crocosphaera sp.]|nr:DUF1902 domain-containing protein [Crocosphaera sp.]